MGRWKKTSLRVGFSLSTKQELVPMLGLKSEHFEVICCRIRQKVVKRRGRIQPKAE